MRLRRQHRDESPEPRTVRAQDTAPWHGALLEITRLGVELELRDAEIARLRVLLREHGVEIPDELAATR